MGSGKSSVARAYAKTSNTYFLDTDAMIESAQNRSIEEIFQTEGEAYFRDLEKELVAWLKDNVSNAIISTGGGMLAHCEELSALGHMVYLKVPFLSIMSRMSPDELAKRPLFKDKEKAERIYEERNSMYEQKAEIIIDADCDVKEVVSRLSSAINS